MMSAAFPPDKMLNGHGENQDTKGKGRARQWVDTIDNELGKMNGHVDRPAKRHRRRHSRSGSTDSGGSSLQEQRDNLPIAQGALISRWAPSVCFYGTIGKESLIRELRANDVTILLGETGSGKTTRERTAYFPSHTSTPNS